MSRTISPSSHECVVSQLDLFDTPCTQHSILSSKEVELKPFTPLSVSSDIMEFRDTADASWYVDTASTSLMFLVQITNPDGTAIADDEPVALVNGGMPSLISQAEVTYNGKRVSSSMQTFPYMYNFKARFGYKKAAKESFLSMLPWCDDLGKTTSLDTLKPLYESYHNLRSQPFWIGGPLLCDAFMTDKLLLSNVNIGVKLYRASSKFSLHAESAAKNYQVKILDASMWLRKCQVSEEIMKAHHATLLRHPAVYPIVRTEVKPYPIAADTLNVQVPNMYIGRLPDRSILTMVDESSFNGDITTSPYIYQHNNAQNVTMKHGGKNYPERPYNMNFGTNDFMRPYNNVFAYTNQLHDGEPCIGMKYNNYGDGSTVWAANFTGNMNDGSSDHFSPIQRGVMGFEINLREKLKKPSVALAYSEFQSLITIDANGNVTTDF